jgi:WD40 repeat protein
MPSFLEGTTSIGNPNEGPLSGGAQVQLTPITGAGGEGVLDPTTQAYFGSNPATSDVVASGGGDITVTAPAAATGGPVTVLLTDANNNAVFVPAAYSYGPHALWIDPSAFCPTGWTNSILSANGPEPFNQNNAKVTIDGTVATLLGISVSQASWISLDVPPGNPGWADLKLSLADGTSETTKNMVQYLAQDVTLPSAAYTSAVYDSARDRFYLTGADNTIGVFDPETQKLLQAMQSSTVSSAAVLGSLALAPDSSRLLVSDPMDGKLVVFDLTSGASTAISVLLPSDGSATIAAPMPVVAVAGNRALVLLTPWTQNEVREIDLTQMTVQVRTDFQNDTLKLYAPLTMASSTDGSVALMGGGPGGNSTAYWGNSDVWKYDAASDTFTGPVASSATGAPVAANADGSVLDIGTFTLEQNLSPLVPFQTGAGAGSDLLTATGALQFNSAGQISDTHNGRELLSLPPISGYTTAFAIDPSGQKIVACAGPLLTYYELAVIPLAVGTVSPAVATPGTTLTIRGDGFVAGTTVSIAGKSASCSMVDDQTLQCVTPNVNAGLTFMTLSNPDGQVYSLEAAVTVQ